MHSAFDPASPQARAVAHLWWWMFGIGGTVWVIVISTMLLALRRRRAARGPDELMQPEPALDARVHRIINGATFVTVLILVGFLAFDFTVGRVLAQPPTNPLTIELTGHQWWWEAQYMDQDLSKRIVTANEMHVPVGQPVRFLLKSVDVIHSFWAPNLNGKRDLIPGYQSMIWFQADTVGTYRGQCAEFCGLQHAKMAFTIVADPKPRYQAWFAAANASPPPPTDSTLLYGQRVFMSAGCSVCHTIGGTEARSTIGPNLTHFKSRSMIASGTLANTKVNVARWVMNPQVIKPGTQMPPSPLSTVQLNALVAYLETLK
jgi:cytochrome c oxidase subunit 2